MYPLADITVEVDGCSIKTVVAVCDTLPMDVLLGTDVLELGSLLRKVEDRSKNDSLALVATTWSRAKKEAEEERLRSEKQLASGVSPNPVEEQGSDVWDIGTKLDNSVLQGGWEKVHLSRRQKCEDGNTNWYVHIPQQIPICSRQCQPRA